MIKRICPNEWGREKEEIEGDESKEEAVDSMWLICGPIIISNGRVTVVG